MFEGIAGCLAMLIHRTITEGKSGELQEDGGDLSHLGWCVGASKSWLEEELLETERLESK